MKLTITLILSLAFSAVAGAETCEPGERVFADVPEDHPLCAEIEGLYRSGGTSGCRVDDDGTLYYCPDATPNRAQMAAFARGSSNPWAKVSIDGELVGGEGALNAERIQDGVYIVGFELDVTDCAVVANQRGASPRVALVGRLDFSGRTVMVVTYGDGGAFADSAFDIVTGCP